VVRFVDLINDVSQRQVRLVLEWVTVGTPLKLKDFYLLCVRWNREIDFIASVLAFYKFVA